MVDFEFKAIARRIRKCALDLLSLGGDLINENDDNDYDSWDLIQKDLRLKSTFLFCDLNKMINGAARDHRNALTELSNKFFCSIEEVILLHFYCFVVLHLYQQSCFLDWKLV